MASIELPAIKESTEDFEKIEARIKAAFRKAVYVPLMRDLSLSNEYKKILLSNEYKESALLEALRTGRITYSKGIFSGSLNAAISKELRELGVTWNRKAGVFQAPVSKLPRSVRTAISAGEVRFMEKIAGIDKKLAKILPEFVAGLVKLQDLFDSVIWKTDRSVSETLKGISVQPKLSDGQRSKIAAEWQGNMDLWIKDFTQEEILKLRADIRKAGESGNRRETLIKSIQKSYDVTANKAKFLARQETSLLMTKLKETRYTDAGVLEYKWACVAGSKNHPVRPAHKRLEGKIFRWDDPPITSALNEPVRRNNPGQDFNCRCTAKPIVRFKENP